MKSPNTLFLLALLPLMVWTHASEFPQGMITGGTQGVYNPAVPEELRVRGGLPNFFKKVDEGKTVRVAYCGGSITQSEGWRPKTFEWLKDQYPKAKFMEINAAIPGTGASFASCRAAVDLLQHKPDLVFVEFRVNGARGFDARAIEGLVRQIWTANPETDICMVYTIGHWMIKDFEKNQQFEFGVTMERLANIYGIPSIDLGVEVFKQIQADKLLFRSKFPSLFKLHFSKDGVHPLKAGHNLYRDIVARSLLTLEDQNQAGEHILPEPVVQDHFANASLLPVAQARLSSHWESVDTKKDDLYTRDTFRTHAMLRGAVKCDKVGASFSIDWTGQLIALTTIPQGKDMEIEVSIDGEPAKTVTLKQKNDQSMFAEFYYQDEQSSGQHTLKITVSKLPPSTSFYCGQFLVIGQP